MARGEVRYKLSLDTKEWESGWKKAQSFATGFSSSVLLPLTAAATAAAGGLAFLTAKVVEQGSKINDLSQKTATSAGFIQKIGYAAKLSGSDVEVFTRGLGVMQRNLADTGEGSKIFRQLNLDTAQLRASSPEKVFFATAEAIKGLKSPYEQARAAQLAFGKAGIEMLPAIRAGLVATAADAERLGFIMSDRTVAAADMLGDSFDTLKLVIGGFGNQIGAVFVENSALHVFLKGVTELIGKLSIAVGSNKKDLNDWVTGGVLLAAESLVNLSDKARLAVEVINALDVVDRAGINMRLQAQLAMAKGDRDILGKFNTGIRERAVVEIANLTAQIDKNALAAGKAIDQNTEWVNAIYIARQGIQELEQKVRSASGTLNVNTANVNRNAAALGKLRAAAAAYTAVANLEARLIDATEFSGDPGLGGSTLFGGMGAYQTITGTPEASPYYGLGVTEAELYAIRARATRYIDDYEKKLEKARQATQDWTNGIRDVGDAFTELGRIVGGVFGAILAGFGKAIALAARFDAMFRDPKTGKRIGFGDMNDGEGMTTGQKISFGADILSAGIGIFQSTRGIGRGAGALTGAAMGATIGTAIMPVIGTAIGAFIGGVIGFFGGKKKEERPEPMTLGDRFKALLAAAEKGGSRRDVTDFIRRERASGNAIPEVQQYVREQIEAATQAAAGMFALLTIKTAEDARAQAAVFAGIFWAAVKELGIPAAAAAFREAFNKIKLGLAEFNITLPGFDQIERLMNLGENPEFRAAAEAANLAAQALRGLADAAYLTQEILNGFGEIAMSIYQRALNVPGATEEDALRVVWPLLVEGQRKALENGLTVPPEVAELITRGLLLGFTIPISLDERRNMLLAEIRDGVLGIKRLNGNNGNGNNGNGNNGNTYLGLGGDSGEQGGPPPMAGGGHFAAFPGGRLIRVAEGMEGESVVPDSQAAAFAEDVLGAAGGGAASALQRALAGVADAAVNLTVQTTNNFTDSALVATAESRGRLADLVNQDMPRHVRSQARLIKELVRQELRTQGVL